MASNSTAAVEFNTWQWDENYKTFWRYRLDGHGQYLTDHTGNFVREWSRPNPQSHVQPESEDDEDEDEDEEEEDDDDEQAASYGTGELDATRNDSAIGYDPNMAEPAPDDVRDQIVFKGTPEAGWYEPLDSSYRVRTRAEEYQFFKPGRVFSMLWSEPAGEIKPSNRTDWTLHPNSAAGLFKVKHGENAYCSIRRFVIVRVNLKQHFVEACAITTYGNRGTLKKTCNPSEHTIVYLKDNKRKGKPETPKSERRAGMTKEPIAIVPTEPGEKMSPFSRLRLGKIYSIECNVKVRDIGMVPNDDKTKLLRYHHQERENGFEPDIVDPETPRPRPAYPATYASASAYSGGQFNPAAHVSAPSTDYSATYQHSYSYPSPTYQSHPAAQHSQVMQTSPTGSGYTVTTGYPASYGNPVNTSYRVPYATDYMNQDTQPGHQAQGSTK